MVAQSQSAPQATWTTSAQRRDQRIGNVPWDQGLLIDRRFVLRNAGYLEYVRLTPSVNFSYVTAGPTGTDPFAGYGLTLAWIRMRANNVGTLWDASGEMSALHSFVTNQYNYGFGSIQPTPPFNFVASPGTTATTDKQSIDLPLALYMGNKPAPLGLFQTATNANETSLELRMRPIVATVGVPGSGLYTGNGANLVAGSTGGTDINQAFFDPIAAKEAEPPLGYINSFREYQASLTADGQNEFILQPSNIYCRIYAWLVTGAAGALAPDSTHLTNIAIRYGANLPIYDEPVDAVNARMQRMYANTIPPGAYIVDLLENTHDERDLIDSAATTNLRIVLTTSGATYSGGAYVKIGVQELIPFQVPGA